MANISILDAINKLVNLKKNIGRATEAAEASMIGYIEGEVKARIHQRGEAHSGQIGDYRSPSHRRKRTAAGRQIGKKDLVFKGNLIRQYGKGTFKGKRVLGFFQNRYRLIAEGQQAQTKKTIFKVRQSEIDEGKKQYLRTYNRILKRSI